MDRGASIRGGALPKEHVRSKGEQQVRKQMSLFTGVRAAQAVPDHDQDRFQKGMRLQAVSTSVTTWGCAGPLTGPFARRFYPNGVLGLAPATWFR